MSRWRSQLDATSSPASACPGWPGQRDRLPALSSPSASSDRSGSAPGVQHAPVEHCSSRMRRLVALSSTTRSFFAGQQGLVVVDRCGRAFRAGRFKPKPDGEVEGGALAGAGHALHPHVAAHQLAQAAADGQPQPGAAKAAGRSKRPPG